VTQPGTPACRSRPSRNSPICDRPGPRGGPREQRKTRVRACGPVARRAATGGPCRVRVAARALLPLAIATTPCSHAVRMCVAGMTLVPVYPLSRHHDRFTQAPPPAPPKMTNAGNSSSRARRGAVTSRGTPRVLRTPHDPPHAGHRMRRVGQKPPVSMHKCLLMEQVGQYGLSYALSCHLRA
jgi:hypothetical protein